MKNIQVCELKTRTAMLPQMPTRSIGETRTAPLMVRDLENVTVADALVEAEAEDESGWGDFNEGLTDGYDNLLLRPRYNRTLTQADIDRQPDWFPFKVGDSLEIVLIEHKHKEEAVYLLAFIPSDASWNHDGAVLGEIYSTDRVFDEDQAFDLFATLRFNPNETLERIAEVLGI